MDNLVEKMLNQINWEQSSLDHIFTAAKRAVYSLKKSNQQLEFLFASVENNVYISVLLIQYFTRAEIISKEQELICMQEVRTWIQQIMDGEWQKEPLRNLPILCASALAMDDKGLLQDVCNMASKTFEEPETAYQFFDNVYKCSFLNHRFPIYVQMARLFKSIYDTFLDERADDILYMQNITLPVEDDMPDELLDLINHVFQNAKFRLLNRILKTFRGIRLETMGITSEVILQKTIQSSDKTNFYRGLMISEKLMLARYMNESEALKKWWDLVTFYKDDDSNEEWLLHKEWLRMYYLNRRILLDPKETSLLLAQEPPFMQLKRIPRVKTTEMIQDVVHELILQPNKTVIYYLEKLGESNPFFFENGYDRNPRRALVTNPRYKFNKTIGIMINHGFSIDEIIYVYMNSHLRFVYHFYKLLRVLFPEKKQIEPSNPFINVTKYFSKYKLKTVAVSSTGSRKRVYVENIKLGEDQNVLFDLNWENKNKEWLKLNFQIGQEIPCFIDKIYLKNMNFFVIPWEFRPNKD